MTSKLSGCNYFVNKNDDCAVIYCTTIFQFSDTAEILPPHQFNGFENLINQITQRVDLNPIIFCDKMLLIS